MAKKYKTRTIKYKEDGKIIKTTYKTRKGAERLYNKLVKKINPMLIEQGKEKYTYGGAAGKSLSHLEKQIKYMSGVLRKGYVGMSTGRYKKYLEDRINSALSVPMDDENYNTLSTLQMVIEDMSDYAFERFYAFMDKEKNIVNKQSLFELRSFYSGDSEKLVDKAQMILDYLEEFAYTLKENSSVRETILNHL